MACKAREATEGRSTHVQAISLQTSIFQSRCALLVARMTLSTHLLKEVACAH